MDFTNEVGRLYYDEKKSIREVASVLNTYPLNVRLCLINHYTGPRSHRESWILRSNQNYSKKLRQAKIGDKNSSAKLTETDVLKIREEYSLALLQGKKKTETQYLLARKYNVKRPTISDIVLRKTWKHI